MAERRPNQPFSAHRVPPGYETSSKPDSIIVPPQKENSRMTELMKKEQDAWFDVLGARVEIKPLPAYVTPEVEQKLEFLGMELRYIPALDIGTLDDLKNMQTEEYLVNITMRYPTWRPYGSLNEQELADPRVMRNITERGWNSMKNGTTDFPELTGYWMAVETLEKPNRNDTYKYDRTLFTDKLGFRRRDRLGTSMNEVTQAMANKKDEIFSYIGLSGQEDMRFLEALEWNLLGNREGWGETDTFELLNTEQGNEYDNYTQPLIIGDINQGGAGGIYTCDNRKYIPDYVGYRAAIILPD